MDFFGKVQKIRFSSFASLFSSFLFPQNSAEVRAIRKPPFTGVFFNEAGSIQAYPYAEITGFVISYGAKIEEFLIVPYFGAANSKKRITLTFPP